ncbi:MAG: glycosyltransferase family 39 protein, partial [Phycisphaerales bacterium]|nr:glycosyltransferase family 39 protein [Phycisphaerales bacterium]
MAATQPAAESSLIAGDTRTADSESRHRLACIAVILIGVVINLLYVLVRCPLDLSGDEAHYWDWSRHLDISYYSKGPLVACIIASSRWLMGLLAPNASLDPAAVVRMPAILLSVLTSIGVVALSRGIGLSWRGVLVALLVCASTPMFTVGAMLMTIDAPFLCAWIWAHVFVVRAIRSEHNLGWWIGTALLVAVGILAKYTMGLLYLVIAVAILSRAGLRKRLLTRTSVIAGAVGLTGLAPIVFWNAAHQWVSFRHVAGQAGVS